MRYGLMDCNNFFVSCERLFRPDLVGKPVAVLSSNDGCFVARSAEVKALGIPMGAPHFQYKDICRQAGVTLFSGNLTLYRDISTRVMATLAAAVGPCEIYSIDEAFFAVPEDVTEAELVAIREQIWQEVGIPVSIGVAATKTLAKYASEVGKRGTGVYVLTADDWAKQQRTVPTGEIWNLGASTARALRDREVSTVAEFLALPRATVERQLGVHGVRIYDELSGTAIHSLHENSRAVRQSIASTRSLAAATQSLSVLESAVARHVEHIAAKLRERELLASSLLVQLRPARHSDWFLHSASVTIPLTPPTNSTGPLLRAALAAVRRSKQSGVPYKKTGVVAVGLVPTTCSTLSLFTPETTTPESSLDGVIDQINQRRGGARLTYATTQVAPVVSNAALRSPHYTTLWKDIPSIRA